MGEPPCILIVDDERFNIQLLTDFLQQDYKIMSAGDGDTGLKSAQSVPPPDLILLDIIMQGIDGYEVCKRLKENDLTQSIPVIFVTAVLEVTDAARAFELGAVDYITKPFNPVTVKARVDMHIRHHRTLKALTEALRKVKTLSGLLPICSHCKKIRDDKGYWKKIEAYIREHSEVGFSHSICPDCAKEFYPTHNIYDG